MISAPFSSDHQAPRFRKQHVVFDMSFELEVASNLLNVSGECEASSCETSHIRWSTLWRGLAGMGDQILITLFCGIAKSLHLSCRNHWKSHFDYLPLAKPREYATSPHCIFLLLRLGPLVPHRNLYTLSAAREVCGAPVFFSMLPFSVSTSGVASHPHRIWTFPLKSLDLSRDAPKLIGASTSSEIHVMQYNIKMT